MNSTGLQSSFASSPAKKPFASQAGCSGAPERKIAGLQPYWIDSDHANGVDRSPAHPSHTGGRDARKSALLPAAPATGGIGLVAAIPVQRCDGRSDLQRAVRPWAVCRRDAVSAAVQYAG